MKKIIKYLLVSLIICLTPCLFIGCKKEENKFSVEIPEPSEGCGYEVVLPDDYDDSNIFYVKENGSYSFTFVIDEMYDISKVVVKANDVEISTVKNYESNSITVNSSNITANTKYTVHNLVKKEFTANFQFVKYTTGNLESTTSTLGLEEISVKIGNKSYTLNQLVETNINLFGFYGDEVTFLAKSNEEDKYLNLEKLFVIGSDTFTYDNNTKEYLPINNIQYLLKGYTKDEDGWLPYSAQLKNNVTIYINNECLSINQKYLTKESGLDIPNQINSIYGDKVNILNSLINPNNISKSLIKTEYYINSNWQLDQPVNAGSYKARITFAGNDYYYPFSKEFDFNINKRTIVYDVHDIDILYGEKPSINITENKSLSMGYLNSTDIDTININYNILDTNNNVISDTSMLNVNSYQIKLEATSNNYKIEFKNVGILTVNPATLPDNVIIANNINKTYDKETASLNIQILEEFKQKLTVIYKPYEMVNGQKEYSNSTTTAPVFNEVYNGGVDIVLTNTNYITKTISVIVTISKAIISTSEINVNNIETTYDGNPHTFNIELSKELNLEDFVITYNSQLEIPSITDVNENNVNYYDIELTSKNYEDFILEDKFIKITKATPSIKTMPTHNKVFVGDNLSELVLNTDYEITGVNNENLTGNLVFSDNNEIISSTEFKTSNISFIPDSNNYKSINLDDYIISATQLTVTIPNGLTVKNFDTNETLNVGTNNIDNNTKLVIVINEIDGYQFDNLKANNMSLNYDNELNGYSYIINNESLILTIDYSIVELQLNSLNNLSNISYNYGESMGEVELLVSHPIADNYSYAWYKLKENNEDIINQTITDELLTEYFENTGNTTNKLSIYSCDEGGYYVAKVESTFTDIEEKVVNLDSYSNLVHVTTEKLRCYISEEPSYLAKVGDLIKDIEFTGGKVVTKDGVEVDGEIKTINVLDTDSVTQEGTEVEFKFVPSDTVNFYYDQSEEDSEQNFSTIITNNCYAYTFIYADGTTEVINVIDGQTLTLPVVTTGSYSWKIQGTGIFITSGKEVVVGVDKDIDLKDIVFVAA